MRKLFFSISFFVFSSLAYSQVELVIPNLQSSNGNVFIAIYNSAQHFLDQEKAMHKAVIPIQEKPFVYSIKDLPEGKYAIAFFHDEDGNKILNTFFGYPLEPYGFSGNKKGSKLGPPSFEETAFTFDGSKMVLNAKLFY